MSIKKKFNGAVIRKPGSYSKSTTDNSGGAQASTGVMLILGEAETGEPGSSAGMKQYSASQMGALIAEYTSGPIVDCAKAAVQPSKTNGIGGFDSVIVWKTNASTRAAKQLVNGSSANLINVQAAKWGLPGNYLTVTLENGTNTSRQRIITIRDKRNLVTEVLDQNAGAAQVVIQYTGAGSAATATITGASENAKTFATTCTGATGDNVSINLKDYTMKDLVDYLNAFGGGGKYTATLSNTSTGTVLKGTELDPITASDIKTAPVSLYRLQNELVDVINENSQLVIATKNGIATGIPAALSETYLTGGAKGASSNTNFSDGLSAALGEDCNVIVPAISRNATSDISDDKTDAASTYTIASVLAALDSHLRLRGNTKNRKEAQGFAGMRDAVIANVITQAATLNSELVQLCAQDVLVSDVSGDLSWKQPHVMAAMCAGMRCGMEVGTPLTHKYLNVSGVGHAVNPATGLSTGDFDPQTDFDQAIDGGILFAEKVAGGQRIVLDCTTYAKDESFVWNRGSVIQAAQYIAQTMRQTAEDVFVGNKVSNGAASSIKSVLRNKLRELNKANITTASVDAPLGYVEKTFTVEISGNTAEVNVEVKPVQGLDFVLISFTLGDIRQSA